MEISGSNAGKLYPGSSHQYEFMEGKWDEVSNMPEIFLEEISEETLE